VSDAPLPLSVVHDPRPDRWLPSAARVVRLSVVNVAIGQGVLTALAQHAAAALDVPLAAILVIAEPSPGTCDGATHRAPASTDPGSGSNRATYSTPCTPVGPSWVVFSKS